MCCEFASRELNFSDPSRAVSESKHEAKLFERKPVYPSKPGAELKDVVFSKSQNDGDKVINSTETVISSKQGSGEVSSKTRVEITKVKKNKQQTLVFQGRETWKVLRGLNGGKYVC